jgi:hypothetical protein
MHVQYKFCNESAYDGAVPYAQPAQERPRGRPNGGVYSRPVSRSPIATRIDGDILRRSSSFRDVNPPTGQSNTPEF